MIGIVKVLTAPKVRAIPRTLKYAAQPAINNAEAPIIRVNKFIQYFLSYSSLQENKNLFPYPKVIHLKTISVSLVPCKVFDAEGWIFMNILPA